jgi:polysaccharide pyruvyl transferase WcaK-like protein
VGFHQALNLDNFVINIRDLNSKILIEKIECLLDNYISIRNEVELRVTSLKAKTFSEIKNSLLKPYGDKY